MNDRFLNEVRVPQLGEGLREVRIAEILQATGRAVRRGDPLYSVETDKSTVELEAPFDGVLVEWVANVGDIVSTNAVVAFVAPAASDVAVPQGSERAIPPRTRAYARLRNVPLELLKRSTSPVAKLLPSHVDAYLAAVMPNNEAQQYAIEHPVSAAHRALIFRLRQSSSVVIPASITSSILWADLSAVVRNRSTQFQVFALAVARTARLHPRFRSVMVQDDTIREYRHANLGLAISRPDGGLVVAPIPQADQMKLQEFSVRCFGEMRRAIRGDSAPGNDTQILLTHIVDDDVVNAIPTLVSPASSIFFLSRPDASGRANVTVTFDHRLMNGVAAAAFLADLKHQFKQMAVE
ncbi:MAG TPA: 2-oxo acid dehydrogenase subunit E2 [Casimicrobiaceae bacterium]|nr:2-oxo acid dehydrogenase subunit E2 [Casimicrobiaceae bacterium]